MELFVQEALALGVLHKAGGIILTKPERSEKIRVWLTPKDLCNVLTEPDVQLYKSEEELKFLSSTTLSPSQNPKEIIGSIRKNYMLLWNSAESLITCSDPRKQERLIDTRRDLCKVGLRAQSTEPGYCLDTGSRIPDRCTTKIQIASFRRHYSRYSMSSGNLYIEVTRKKKVCVIEKEVTGVLLKAHDNSSHFIAAITIRKLREYFWPHIARDIRDYIQGYLTYARFRIASKSQTIARVIVSRPIELLSINFIGPFPRFDRATLFYILLAVDYFSRFIWTEATLTNDSETTIQFLKRLFEKDRVLVGIYADLGPHFSAETKAYAESRGVV
ncbi:uncharacterized protein RSE6_14903 [Rhynchosporium secalis]|uniref:Integrase catalytic domain-containing protein n=1 Tax=Rhynchosporium secalis TaxID=38038 RepID=A0A1E1MWD5_RHYSE|nr:uncharacterized protein RSE6_14903 [Rhynchosporium secalis]